MSIQRSGLVKPVKVLCVKPLNDQTLAIKEGETCELILEMSTMYVVKTSKGQETVVPKDAFVLVKD